MIGRDMARIEITTCDECGRPGLDGTVIETWTAVADPTGRTWTRDLCTTCADNLLNPTSSTGAPRKRRTVVKGLEA